MTGSGKNLRFENASNFVGKELGVSSWHVVDQNMINQFAAAPATPVDSRRREAGEIGRSPFGGPVAHGYLSLALIAPLSMEIGVVPEDAAAAFNYGIDKVRFLAPVKAGSKVRLNVYLMDFTPRDDKQVSMKTRNTLEIEGEAKPALIAETLASWWPPALFREGSRGSAGGKAAGRDPRLPGQTETASDDQAAAQPWLSIRLIGLRGDDLVARRGRKAMITNQPAAAAASWMNFVGGLAKIVSGQADEKPDPRDKRFADPAWTKSKVHARSGRPTPLSVRR